MNVAWFDASNGLAGDMFCAALLDAGAELGPLNEALSGLNLPGWTLHTHSVQRGVFGALHFHVEIDGDQAHHRSWADIRQRIEGAELPDRVRDRALRVFAALAEAEARVHGVPVDAVEFHEVGAIDSIIDIVGACLLLEQLDIGRIVGTALPAGGGMIKTQHGPLVVPAPATVDVLGDWPLRQDGRKGELVTPTGAALLAVLGTAGPMPSMRVQSSGYGAGTWNPAGWSNTTRVVVGEAMEIGLPQASEQVVVLEAQVDDMPGEQVPPLIDALLAAGALDACAAPVVMKKGRPGLLLTVLATPTQSAQVEETMLRHSSTFGVRRHLCSRRVLARRHDTVSTPWGPVRVKIGSLEDDVVQVAPEYDDCIARSLESGVPIARVQDAARAVWYQEHGWP